MVIFNSVTQEKLIISRLIKQKIFTLKFAYFVMPQTTIQDNIKMEAEDFECSVCLGKEKDSNF